MAISDKIVPKNSIKILGIYIRSDLKLDTQINKLCSNLHNRLFQLRKITKYSTFSTRLNFIKSYVIGKLIYAMPLYMSCSQKNIATLHKVIMTSARTAIGNYCYKKSITYILNKCGILDAKNIILLSCLSLYFKMYQYNEPEALINTFKKQNVRAKTTIFRPAYRTKLKSTENGFLYKGARIFNEMPTDMKLLTRDKFITSTKAYLDKFAVWDSYD